MLLFLSHPMSTMQILTALLPKYMQNSINSPLSYCYPWTKPSIMITSQLAYLLPPLPHCSLFSVGSQRILFNISHILSLLCSEPSNCFPAHSEESQTLYNGLKNHQDLDTALLPPTFSTFITSSFGVSGMCHPYSQLRLPLS